MHFVIIVIDSEEYHILFLPDTSRCQQYMLGLMGNLQGNKTKRGNLYFLSHSKFSLAFLLLSVFPIIIKAITIHSVILASI